MNEEIQAFVSPECLKKSGFSFIQNNQLAAIKLIEENIEEHRLFLKIGTGQGKSLIMLLSALRLLDKKGFSRVFIFTSYEHLAKRDFNNAKKLLEAKTESDKWDIDLICVESLDSLKKIPGKNNSGKGTIIYTDLTQYESLVYSYFDSPGESDFNPYEVSSRDVIMLDEFDLLTHDYDARSYVSGGVVSEVASINPKSGKFNGLTATGGRTESVFHFLEYLKEFEYVVCVSGSAEESDIKPFKGDYFINTDKTPVFMNIPNFYDTDDSQKERKKIEIKIEEVKKPEAAIKKNVEDAIGKGQPVLVFTDPDNTKNWNAYKKILEAIIKRKESIPKLHEVLDDRNSQLLDSDIQKIGEDRQITLAGPILARGIDIRTRTTNENGMHLVIACVPQHNRLLKQMLGRVGRMDGFGSYSIITNLELPIISSLVALRQELSTKKETWPYSEELAKSHRKSRKKMSGLMKQRAQTTPSRGL